MNFTYLQSTLLCTSLFLVGICCSAQTYKVEEVSYEFSIEPISGVNSKYDDFSPILFNDKIIFTSGRESNLVLLGENNWGKTGFYNLFIVDLKKKDSANYKTSTSSIFDKSISNNNHTGPACFNSDHTVIFFTQLTERKKGVREIRNPQIYSAQLVDNQWQNIELLPFCDSAYAFGHPSWDEKSNTLYFSSNMPGGKGGKDIYSVKKNGDGTWGKPVNLEWNSVDNDMFPFIIGSDLFFSSDRGGGSGGLDIYWKILNSPEPLQNIKQLNTAEDDHGIYITADHLTGCFSRRVKGNDDLFMLNVTRKVRVTNELAGQFTYRNLGTDASGLQLQLLHDEDVVLDISTDDNGEFKFRELPFENYTIKTSTTDHLELVLYDKDGRPQTYLLQDGEGKFQYKKAGLESVGTLSILEEMNEKWLDFTDISGQFVYDNIPGEYGDSLKVMLLDEDGNIIFTEYSDDRGNFTFVNVPTDQNYLITTEDVDEDMFLLIYDQDGNVFTQLKQNDQGEFTYKKIKPDLANNLQMLADEEDVFETKTEAITGNFNYKKLEGDFNDGLTVYLFSEDGFLLDSTVTSQGGQFMFRGLDPEQSYLFKMKENDSNFKLDEFNLHLEDRYGKVLADLYRAGDGFYRYREINTDTSTNLTEITTTNEPAFDLDTNPENTDQPIVRTGEGFNVYFDRNSSYTDLKSYDELDQLIKEMKINTSIVVNIYAYADCRDSDHYNLWLSERRGNRLKEFMINRGIDASRIKIEAFGESKLVNSCADGSSCEEEEHAKNRRVEVIVSGR